MTKNVKSKKSNTKTKQVQKITLASSRDIPFNKLMLSQANVRRIKSGVSIEELAKSIARRGLIQSLNVRPVIGEDGKETGMYEVPAGGRRFRALELLVKDKRLNKTAPVPCIVNEADTDVSVDEVSLAENIERAPLHPLDQFRAFVAMRENGSKDGQKGGQKIGMSEEEIAAAFFVPVNVVKQRLRLASVSPKLLEVYAEDDMTLEQLMAFTITDDHERQEQVWEAISKNWQNEPWHIRRMLSENTVRASDKRAVFVGLEAYEEAGGTIVRDLFEEDNGGILQDVGLLDRLASEKLKLLADETAQQGWKWVEVATSFPYGVTHGLREIEGTSIDLTAEELATRQALEAEYDRLNEEYSTADELPDEIDERLGEVETALDAFDNRPMEYDPGEVAIAGVFVSIGADGRLEVARGYVRPEDEQPIENDADGTGNNPEDEYPPAMNGEHYASANTAGNTAGEAADNDAGGRVAASSTSSLSGMAGSGEDAEDNSEDGGIKPLPDRLVSELTAHRTLALRDAVGNNPHIAMTMLLHKLVSDAFLSRYTGSGCLEVNVREVYFPEQSEDLKDCSSTKSIEARHQAWADGIPTDDQELWDWLDNLDEASRAALLAHCISFGINALHEKPNPYGGSGTSEYSLKQRLDQAGRLAGATGLDMIEAGWQPTASNYLGRVTKARILAAVREGVGDKAAERIEHLKRDDMAKQAETLLADTGWLPEPLRSSNGQEEGATVTDAEVETADDAIDQDQSDNLDGGEQGQADDSDSVGADPAEDAATKPDATAEMGSDTQPETDEDANSETGTPDPETIAAE